MHGAKEELLKAVWTAAFINDLPDSAFLYVAPGGEKDERRQDRPPFPALLPLQGLERHRRPPPPPERARSYPPIQSSPGRQGPRQSSSADVFWKTPPPAVARGDSRTEDDEEPADGQVGTARRPSRRNRTSVAGHIGLKLGGSNAVPEREAPPGRRGEAEGGREVAGKEILDLCKTENRERTEDEDTESSPRSTRPSTKLKTDRGRAQAARSRSTRTCSTPPANNGDGIEVEDEVRVNAAERVRGQVARRAVHRVEGLQGADGERSAAATTGRPGRSS